MTHEEDPKDDFLAEAAGKQAGLVSELIGFLKANKKWWMLPLFGLLLIGGFLVMLMTTSAPLSFTSSSLSGVPAVPMTRAPRATPI